jgi:hypothetical protein
LRVVESLPALQLPVTSANVRGLMQQGQKRLPSDFGRFGYPEQPLDRLIASALRFVSGR